MQAYRPIILLALGETLIWASLYYLFPSLLLRWEADLGWSRAEVTGAITVAVLMAGLCAPIAGTLIDRGKGAEMMAGCALLAACGLFALSGVTALWQFYLVWAVNGAAMAGALYEPCFAIVTRARGATAKGAITLITLVAGFAGTISFPLSNLGADMFGWRVTAMIAAAIVAFAVAPLLWMGAKGLGPTEADVEPHGNPRPFNWRQPVFLFLAAAFACTAFVHGATLQHLLPILADKTVEPGFAILIASLIGPMQVTGRLVMLTAGRFLSAHIFALGMFAMMSASVIVLRFSDGSQFTLICFVVLFGASYGTISILRPVLARDILGGSGFGAKSGALALPYMVAAASSPYIASLGWSMGGYGLVLGACGGLAGIGALLYLTAHRIRHKDW